MSSNKLTQSYEPGNIQNGELFDASYINNIELGIQNSFIYSNSLEEKIMETESAIDNLTNDIPNIVQQTDVTIDQLVKGTEHSTIPESLLPSYVDDVIEYSNRNNFPSTGESSKIYIDTSTNLTYRWSGSTYIEISSPLTLGTSENDAYRGDYGEIAYQHSQAIPNESFEQSLYKIATNKEGHIIQATKVTATDIINLGIPTYSIVTKTSDGLVPKFDQVGGTITNNTTDWVLTNKNGTLDWYKLPSEAFSSGNIVSVTQTLHDGTEIASIVIDGENYKLYAPSATSGVPGPQGPSGVGITNITILEV